MIKSLTSNSPFLTVSGGMPAGTYIAHGSGPGLGNMRYNPNSQNIEVFDGSLWVIMQSNSAYISLDNEAISLLEWARKKRNEELELERLAQTSPIIKDLVNQIKDKEEQISMIETLLNSTSHNEIKNSMVP
jgi:hypothetical protein